MKILIAPDSFKGSLTSMQASRVMKKAIQDINSSYKVILKPMADGGEGTLDVMLATHKGRNVPVECSGPLGNKIKTSYAILDSNVAVIEYAKIAGLTHVPLNLRDPDHTTSFGLGEVILNALDKGCKSFILGLGGSATNDGGLGMLLALGVQAWDEEGVKVDRFGVDVQNVDKINFDHLDSRLVDVDIKVACDVDNLLCGEQGASIVYAPQKGATEDQVHKYDKALKDYGILIESETGKLLMKIPGSGAAGGLGFALLSIGAELLSGAKLLADFIHLEDGVKEVDLVITGEGQSDGQTLYGKAPGYIASIASEYNVPAILISGILKNNLTELRKVFSGCFSIINQPLSVEESIEQAEHLLYQQTINVFHLIDSILKNKLRSE